MVRTNVSNKATESAAVEKSFIYCSVGTGGAVAWHSDRGAVPRLSLPPPPLHEAPGVAVVTMEMWRAALGDTASFSMQMQYLISKGNFDDTM